MANSDGSWGDDGGGSGGDRFTHVTRTGWLQRILGSFGGAVVGILLFLGAFVLLYWNEGRLDLSKIARVAEAVPASAPAPEHVGKLVAVTGSLTTQGTLADDYVAAGPYVALKRNAEMYAWKEREETETKTEVGGSEKKVTTYSYVREWTSRPEDSSDFKHPQGHRNPPMRVKSTERRAMDAKVGVFGMDPDKVGMPAYEAVPLSASKGGRVSGNHLYVGAAEGGEPRIGDIRVSYEAVRSGKTVTLFGKLLQADQVGNYTHKTGDELYRAIAGDKNDAVRTLHGEHVFLTWILRLVGFLMMWIGLVLVIQPINVILDFLPFLGSLGRGLSGFAAFVIAFALSVVTILVSVLLHNILALVLLAFATLVGGMIYFNRKQAAKPA